MSDFFLCLCKEKQVNNIVVVVDNPASHPSPSLRERHVLGDIKRARHHWINDRISSPTQNCKLRHPEALTQWSSLLQCSHASSLISPPAQPRRHEKLIVPDCIPRKAKNIALLGDNAAAHRSLPPRAQSFHDDTELLIHQINDCFSPLTPNNRSYRQAKLARRTSPSQPSSLSSPAEQAEQEVDCQQVHLSSPVKLPCRSFDRWEGATSPIAKCDAPLVPPRLCRHPCRWESEEAASSSDAESSPRLPMRRNRITRKITSV